MRRFVTFDVAGDYQEKIKAEARRQGWEDAIALRSGARMLLPRSSLRSPEFPSNVAAADAFKGIVEAVEKREETKIVVERLLVEAWTPQRVFRSMHHAD